MRMKCLAFALGVVFSICAASAQGQTEVFVPWNTTGGFGNPSDLSSIVPMVKAITVQGPATITVTYVSGVISIPGEGTTGPKGFTYPTNSGCIGTQSPIQEGNGVCGGTIPQADGLIGVFVPQYKVNDPRGFAAVDGTKAVGRIGIRPSDLRFIGETMTWNVNQAGTVYLGINNCNETIGCPLVRSGTSGGFTVEVVATDPVPGQ